MNERTNTKIIKIYITDTEYTYINVSYIEEIKPGVSKSCYIRLRSGNQLRCIESAEIIIEKIYL